jgi:hypothetical protein
VKYTPDEAVEHFFFANLTLLPAKHTHNIMPLKPEKEVETIKGINTRSSDVVQGMNSDYFWPT